MLNERIIGLPVYIITNDVSRNSFTIDGKESDEVYESLFRMRKL